MYEEVQKGIDLIWSNKFDEAEKFFEEYKETKPRYALHYAEISVFRAVITELAKERDEAVKRMNHAIRIAELILKEFEAVGDHVSNTERNEWLDARIVLADAHTIMAGLLLMEEARVKALMTLRKGWKIYKHILSQVRDESHFDQSVLNSLKFGAGLFYFIISFIPPGIAQKVAAMAGFGDGNKDLGLKFLEDCSNSNSVRRQLARIVLAMNKLLVSVAPTEDIMRQLHQEADEIIQDGLQAYPEGSVFQITAAVSAMEMNHHEKAISLVNQAIQNCKHITDYAGVFMRVLSNAYLTQYNWEKACETLEDIVQVSAEGEKQGKFKNPWSYTWNVMRFGTANVMIGNEKKARKCFSDIISSKQQDRWSKMVRHLATRYNRTDGYYFSMLELLHLTGYLEKSLQCTSTEKKQQILDTIEDIAKKTPGALSPLRSHQRRSSMIDYLSKKVSRNTLNDVKIDNRCCYAVLKSVVLRALDKKDESISLLKEVITHSRLLIEKMYYGLALMQMGKLCALEDPKKACEYFETVLKTNFPWDNAVKSQARAYMRYCAEKDSSIQVEKVNNDDNAQEDGNMNEEQLKNYLENLEQEEEEEK